MGKYSGSKRAKAEGRPAREARRRSGDDEDRQTPEPFSDLAALQKAAGNEAVTSLLQGDSGLAIQRSALEYGKDLYHHAKDLVKPKKEGEADDGKAWEERSEEVALHTREAFDLASYILKKKADLVKGADPTGAAETLEYAEGFDKASELVKTGGEVFEKGVKVVKIIQATKDLQAAIKEVNSHDLLSDPAGSAKAFEHLFTATGEFATDAAPKGPWTGYFELLKHFGDNGGFFTNVSAQYRGEVGPEADALRREGMDPSKENRWRAEPKGPAEDKVSLKTLQEDVTNKVNRLKEIAHPPVIDLALEYFNERYSTFVAAWDAYDRLSFMSKVRKTETAMSLKAALNEATDDLIASLAGLQRDATGTDISFQGDIDTLRKVKE